MINYTKYCHCPNYVLPISYAHFIQSYHCQILMSTYHLPAHDIMLCTDFRINTHILKMTYKVQQSLALPASPVLCYNILHLQSNSIGLLLISHVSNVLPFSAHQFSCWIVFFFFCINVLLIPKWLLLTVQISVHFSFSPESLPDLPI